MMQVTGVNGYCTSLVNAILEVCRHSTGNVAFLCMFTMGFFFFGGKA